MDSSSESSFEVPLSPSKRVRPAAMDPQLPFNTVQLPTFTTVPIANSSAHNDTPVSKQYILTKANYVNLQLTAYGYPVPLIFDSKDNRDTLQIINCMQLMLQDIKKSEDERREFQETIVSLQQEQDQTQSQLDRYIKDLESCQQELAESKIKMQSLKEQMKSKDDLHRHVKDELAKAKNNMQYMKTQYAHETRRQNLDHAKTRDRLAKLMKDKLQTNVVSIDIQHESPLAELDLAPATSAEQDAHSFTKDAMQKAVDRERTARKDNEQLSHSLIKVYGSMRRLLESQWQSYEDRFGTIESKKEMLHTIEKFQLSVDGNDLVEQVNALLDRLQEEWQRQVVDTKWYTEQDMLEKDQLLEQWQAQVVELEQEIEKVEEDFNAREEVYLRFSHGGFFDAIAPPPVEPSSDDEWGEYDIDPEVTSKFDLLQLNAKKQQEKITEAALKLGDERTKLQAEKWAFEDMKRQHNMAEVGSPTPETTSKRKRI
ncbi:hypothetical protein DM01DRAFT_1332366 [Hesseltinella vesiculosa]|uniref:Uncharacterized protein n=1 Tax=Hesseltinella vesiculosa TaxID=101127 RepID=A0A1X2GUT0_9FUNG|nr:hypothetical protein DM01DRAFT_1332366 [Hesseltinella vesiculosa]